MVGQYGRGRTPHCFLQPRFSSLASNGCKQNAMQG